MAPAAAASPLVLAPAAPPRRAPAKLLPGFARPRAAVRGPAAGGRGAQQLLPRVPAEAARAAVRSLAAAQLRRPREPAAEGAVKAGRHETGGGMQVLVESIG